MKYILSLNTKILRLNLCLTDRMNDKRTKQVDIFNIEIGFIAQRKKDLNQPKKGSERVTD